MTRDEMAALLNGRETGDEVTKEYIAIAKENELVVLYGYSDDLMEFDGAINGEVGCYDGGTAYLDANGLLENECDNEKCPHFLKQREKAVTIKAIWNDTGFPTWSYKTDIAHTTFDVMEDGDVFCRGIVFSMTDLTGALIAEAEGV